MKITKGTAINVRCAPGYRLFRLKMAESGLVADGLQRGFPCEGVLLLVRYESAAGAFCAASVASRWFAIDALRAMARNDDGDGVIVDGPGYSAGRTRQSKRL